MVTITIKNSNRCEIDGPLKILNKIYEAFRIKHPNAWFLLRNNKTGWDGYIKYISDSGTFMIGLLPKVYNTLVGWGEKVKIIDNRNIKNFNFKVPRVLGDKNLYKEQIAALETLLNNQIGGVKFNICAGNFAVGFGKSLLMCAIHQAYQRKLKSIVLLNDSDLFEQFKKEMPPMLPGEDIVFIRGGKVNKWGNFNVAMVQSLAQNLNKYQYELSKIDIVLIDEADVIDNRTYKSVISRLYNSNIRIGLSGTLYMSSLKKDLVHNMNIMSFIGDKVGEVKLIDQINKGRATPVVVKMVNVKMRSLNVRDYEKQYLKTITTNEEAYKASFERAMYNAQYNRFPMLIVTKFINHCEKLYEFYQKQNSTLGLGWKISYVHHETKDRKKILENFRDGKIDVLISTTIISRGKNFPTLQYLQNTASMDSNEKSIQILGRLVRQHESKSKAYLDDLIFPGSYLSRHGNHRKVYYQRERLKVIIINGPKKKRKKKKKRFSPLQPLFLKKEK